jgi:F-type H+-transporting ATPase subunit delta
MRQTKVASRYAKALFDLALESGKLEEVRQDLLLIAGVNHDEFKTLLASPVIRSDKKIAVFEAVFSGKVQPITISFFKLIFAKGRAVAMAEIIEAFAELYRHQKGIKVVELTTAVPVSDAIVTEIKTLLSGNAFLKGKSIELRAKVDPSILGGLVVQVDDQLFDASIKHDLQHIKRQFIKNMYVSEI